MLSLLLIFIGVVMMTIAVFMMIARFGYAAMNLIGKATYGVMSYFLNHFILKRQLMSDGTLQEYQEEQALREELERAEKENKHKEQIKSKHDKIVYAVLSKVRDLRAKYPLADENLFQEYRDSFTTHPMEYLKDIEETIKRQHFERAKINAIGQYKVEDLDRYEVIERTENKYDNTTITVTLYNDRGTYIVRVQNPENYIDEFYVTRKILLAKHVQNMIIARCKTNYHNKRVAHDAIFNMNDFSTVCSKAYEDVSNYEAC